MPDGRQYAGFKSAKDLKPWEKAYWYLRILIDNDRYGAFGNGNVRKKTELLSFISDSLYATYNRVIRDDGSDEDQKLLILNEVLEKALFDVYPEGKQGYEVAVELHARLTVFLTEPKDYYVLAFTIQKLLFPTNDAVGRVPMDETTKFARIYAEAVLNTKKEKGLATLIREWDSLTLDLCLNKERDIMVELFGKVKESLGSSIPGEEQLTEAETASVLTAISQEYERRTGQKRKKRSGDDLEGAAGFVFKHFGLATYGAPAHFNAAVEVDNWLKDKNGWYIGVSLKRTLRERWKQTDVGVDTLNQFRIKHIIHLISNDKDLSDTKIATLGASRHLFFMADESPVLKMYGKHVAIGQFLFPMSELISKVKELQNK